MPAKRLSAIAMAVVLAAASFWVTPAFAKLGKSVSISNNSGGQIVHYALRAAKYRSNKTLVRFAGRCDSACTLYLGLPSHQTCIAKGAFFRFHAPSARNPRAQRAAQNYLMKKYPGWVRSYISSRGGLGRQLVTMDYGYASQFIRSCSSRVASR